MLSSTRRVSSRRALGRYAAIVLAACLLDACSKPGEPLTMTRIDLGSHVNDDNSVSSPSETFSPSSTVYGSIGTEGTGTGTLAAQWVGADGKVFTDQTQKINPTKPAHFEFHFVPPGGWPPGRHKVIFKLDDGAPRTREFEIR